MNNYSIEKSESTNSSSSSASDIHFDSEERTVIVHPETRTARSSASDVKIFGYKDEKVNPERYVTLKMAIPNINMSRKEALDFMNINRGSRG